MKILKITGFESNFYMEMNVCYSWAIIKITTNYYQIMASSYHGIYQEFSLCRP